MTDLAILWDRIAAAADDAGVERVDQVGGPVRDRLLGRVSKDLDIVVVGDARRLAAALGDRWGGAVILHDRFGTATWTPVALDCGVDLATARTESYPAPGALPVVQASTLQDDLRRRDFTVNAIASSIWPGPRGVLFDPMSGRADLEAGLLRIHHAGSFRDDPTRMFRLARFAARLGFEPTSETAAALAEALVPDVGGRTALDDVSADRLRREWELLCGEPDPPLAVRSLLGLGIGAALGLAEGGPRGLEALDRGWRAASDEGRSWSPALALGLLLAGADVRVARDKLGTGAWGGDVLSTFASVEARLAPRVVASTASGDDNDLEGALGGTPRPERCALEACAPEARGGVRRYETRIADLPPLLTGRDLVAAGMEPGPAIGDSLRRIRRAQLDGTARTAAEALDLLDLPGRPPR